MCIVCASNYTQTIHKPFIEAFKTLHWGVQDPTQRVFAKLYTKRNTNPTFCFWTRISRMEFRKRMERIVRNVCNVRYVRYERKTGNGNRRWRDSSLLRATKKSNNFERFFADSTLTFLTFENTFCLPIFPTRRIIFLCLPLIKIWGRQRKTRGRQIFTGCAP